MSLLSDGDLAAMQTILNLSLPGTVTITRPTLTVDGQGGGSASWSTVGTVACAIGPQGRLRSGREDTVAGRTVAFLQRTLTVPANTDLQVTDRVIVGSETFEVTALHAPRSFELSVRADLVEIV